MPGEGTFGFLHKGTTCSRGSASHPQWGAGVVASVQMVVMEQGGAGLSLCTRGSACLLSIISTFLSWALILLHHPTIFLNSSVATLHLLILPRQQMSTFKTPPTSRTWKGASPYSAGSNEFSFLRMCLLFSFQRRSASHSLPTT